MTDISIRPASEPMHETLRGLLAGCETLLLDMDGTLLDLAFDNYFWRRHVPAEFAAAHGLDTGHARRELAAMYAAEQGRLAWYCLDHWSERLGLDLLRMKREVRGRIAWLPGASEFLRAARAAGKRLVLVTNAHPDTLAVKLEVTGLEHRLDALHSSHSYGLPKEDAGFWDALEAAESYPRERTLLIDDSHAVLAAARAAGLGGVIAVSRPDSGAAPQPVEGMAAVESVAELTQWLRPGPPPVS